MSEIFYKVLEMSIYGSIAILAVLLFRLVFQKCPKRIMILFWIIVALRLVIPFNFNSPTSALNVGKLFVPKSAVSETSSYDPETRLREMTVVERTEIKETSAESLTVVTGQIEPAPSYVAGPEPEPAKATAKDVIPFVWLGVTIGLLIFSAIRYAIFYSKARWSSRSFDGRYYMANDIDSPFVVGIFSPKIFFPINMDDDEREYVLNHEWTHIKNKDGLTKLVSYVILCIHWFNPLVWLAFFMLCADIEMRVDEETTSNFNLKMVKEYCKSLVRHAADDNRGAFMQSTAFSGLSFGGMETKIRIKNLLAHKISSREIQIASICVTLVFSLLVSASSIDHQPWVREEPSEPQESAEITASDTTETTPSDATAETSRARRWDAAFINPYIELILKTGYDNQGNPLYYKYAFIYIDDDLIPELVTARPTEGADYLVSLYTFRDGKVLPVFEDAVYMNSGECYYYVPFEDFIIDHNILIQGEKAEAKIFSMNDLMTGSEPKTKGLFEGDSYSIDGKSVTRDEYIEAFRDRESELIFGKVGPDKAIEILNAQKTSGGTKIPSDITDDIAVSETSETTEETTAETTAETTVPVETSASAEDKLISISKIKDFTVIPFVNENNNYTYKVSGDFGYIICQILPEKVVRFTLKDKTFEYAIPSTDTSGIYLLKDYGKANIFIQFYVDGGNQIAAFNVYDHGVYFKGAVNNATFERKVDNPRTFWIIENYGNDAIVDIRRHYSMSKTTGMPAPDTDLMYTVFKPKKPLKSKVDLSGCLVINGTIYKDQIVTINAGESVTLLRTDEKTIIEIQKEDGRVVRVDFKGQADRFYDSNNYRWVYNAIVDWFEPA